jgi:hypothetical protein
LKDIPQFVLDYAPLVHLNSKEYFWPSDMSEHLEHITTYVNETKATVEPTVRDLGDLNKLDEQNGRWVYLESMDYIDMWKDANIEGLPAWLTGAHNIPVPPKDNTKNSQAEALSDEDLPPAVNEHRPHLPIQIPTRGGRSSAPAVLIVVEKDKGIVDAFWFYFYSYNLGNSVFTFRFGNHVGDWEHSVVRFYDGVPTEMFCSEHEGGKGFTYFAAEKYGKRVSKSLDVVILRSWANTSFQPVIYSASGTHAMYPAPGIQDYVLPFRILRDQTDKGPLWDPLLNMYSYHYNTSMVNGEDRSIRSVPEGPEDDIYSGPEDLQAGTITPTSLTPTAPTSWFYYGGHWGDKYYPRSDHRQYQLGTEKAYVSGPFGPRFKALGRKTVCPRDNCKIKNSIAPRNWALRIFIDYLFAVGIVWLIASIVISSMWCCRFNRRKVPRKFEEDIEDPYDPTEEDSLLGNEVN